MLLDIILEIPILMLMTLLFGFVNIVMWLARKLGIEEKKNEDLLRLQDGQV